MCIRDSYKIAADNGIASASFALGEYYAKTGNREEAVKALSLIHI